MLGLTEDQLRTLLDPMLVLDRPEQQDSALVAQLESVRRQLIGLPLKVDLVLVDPATVDADGILGYVDRVKAEISRLRGPGRGPGPVGRGALTTSAGRGGPASRLFLSAAEAFAGVDRLLARAQTELEQGSIWMLWPMPMLPCRAWPPGCPGGSPGPAPAACSRPRRW